MATKDFNLAGFVPTQGHLAQLLGRRIKTISDRMKQGQLAPAGSTLKDHFDVMFGHGSKLDGEYERARGARAKADIDELKLAKLRSELIEVEFVEAAIVAVLTVVRSEFLALGSSLGPEIATVTDKNQATKLLQDRIYAALAAVAESQIDRIIEDALRRAEASAQDIDAAAEADTQPVD